MSRRTWSTCFFLLALVINPGYFGGCGGESAQFTYGEQEMLGLVEAANDGEDGEGYRFSVDGTDYHLVLALSQEPGEDSYAAAPTPFGARAFACDNRTFLQSASACDSRSQMPLRGTFSLFEETTDGEEVALLEDEPVEGLLSTGYVLSDGDLWLQFDTGQIWLDTVTESTLSLAELEVVLVSKPETLVYLAPGRR